MTRYIFYGAVALSIVLVAGYIGVRVNGRLPVETPPAPALIFDVTAWSDYLADYGTETGMHALVAAAANENSGNQYHAARAFGEALWHTQGEEGLATCAATFRYGCEHGFMMAAVETEGEARAQKLNEWCLLQGPLARQCQHGIGHGLTRHFGDSITNLPRALRACGALPLTRYTNAIDSCMWGATMEYYDHHAPTNDTLTLESCNLLERDYQASCAFTAARWLRIHIKATDLNDRYERIGAACRTGESTETILACFVGAGSQAAQSASFDPNTTNTLCTEAADGSELFKTACLRGAFEQYQSARIVSTHSCWWGHLVTGSRTCSETNTVTDAGAEHDD